MNGRFARAIESRLKRLPSAGESHRRAFATCCTRRGIGVLLGRTTRGRTTGKLTPKAAQKLEWIVPTDPPLRTVSGAIQSLEDCVESGIGLSKWIEAVERELERLRRRRAPGEDRALRESAKALGQSFGRPRYKRDDIRDLNALRRDLCIRQAEEDYELGLLQKGVSLGEIGRTFWADGTARRAHTQTSS